MVKKFKRIYEMDDIHEISSIVLITLLVSYTFNIILQSFSDTFILSAFIFNIVAVVVVWLILFLTSLKVRYIEVKE